MGRPTVSGAASSNKREDVLGAAVRCFAARGLAGTGMRDIARAAGLTEGTLYHYFRSKRALIDAAFRWSAFQATDVRDTMRRSDVPIRDRLLSVGAEFLATLRRRPDWTRLVIREALRAPSAREPAVVRSILVPVAVERTRALAAALRAETANGGIRAHDPRRVADLFFRALIGHFVSDAISRASPARRPETDPFLVHLVDTIANDLASRVRPTRGTPT